MAHLLCIAIVVYIIIINGIIKIFQRIVLTYSWLALKHSHFIAIGECLGLVEPCLSKLHIIIIPVEGHAQVRMFAKLTFELKEFPGKKGRAISRTCL